MRGIVYRVGRRLLGLTVVALMACLLSASLLRFAPGFGVDEREFDARLSSQSVEAIRAANRVDSLPVYYGHYLWSAIHGDFGYSQWLNQPIAALVRERFPVTARSVFAGVLLAWGLAMGACLVNVFVGNVVLELLGTLLSGVLVALPTAAVAIACVYLRAPVSCAIAAAMLPKLYRYSGSLLKQGLQQPHILAARSRGVGEGRILLRHVLPSAAPALFALLGVSLSLAFGAAIPIEALCDSPGVGQLAWQAALNRDLPLMMTLTLVITLITVTANWLASAANEKVAAL